jgi:hypothetical protein
MLSSYIEFSGGKKKLTSIRFAFSNSSGLRATTAGCEELSRTLNKLKTHKSNQSFEIE